MPAANIRQSLCGAANHPLAVNNDAWPKKTRIFAGQLRIFCVSYAVMRSSLRLLPMAWKASFNCAALVALK